ncbi:MAG: NAD-dependent epimerase/dehydratase family protein [Phycisphaerales bacterium]
MRIALTGASGFIGSVVATTLHEAGHHVTGLVRETSRRDHIERVIERFVVGEQADESCWPALLEGNDVVVMNSVDWAPLKEHDLDRHLHSNLLASIRFLDAARDAQQSRKIIFMSSVAVHHQIVDAWEGVVDETHPLRPNSLYGAYKAAVEAHLWQGYHEHGTPFAALRPAAVYGIDPHMTRSIGFPIIRSLRNGEPFTRAGGGKFVHVQDVADAVRACIENDAVQAEVFNLADCYARWSDIAIMLKDILDLQDVTIDTSSPELSKNVFCKDRVRDTLGVQLDRGHEGLKQYLRELVDAVGVET